MSADLRITELKLDGIVVRPSLATTTVKVTLDGNADMGSHAALRSFFGSIETEIRRLKAQTLELDFTQLYFMNSSCLSIFSGLISKLAAAPASSRYRIVFRCNVKQTWQKRSIQALCSFAPDLVTSDLPSGP